MRKPCTEFETKMVDAVNSLKGGELIDELYHILDAATDDAHSDGYSEGHDDGISDVKGKIEDGIADATDGMLADLKQGLDMIDTDRAAAKVYLDRATRSLGKHLIEVSPCLL